MNNQTIKVCRPDDDRRAVLDREPMGFPVRGYEAGRITREMGSRGERPVVVAVVNQKGGVGKTTTTINVCSYMAQSAPTLLIDLDPQANATSSLGITTGDLPSIHEVLVEGLPMEEAIAKTVVPGLSLLPSSPTLVAAELQLAPAMGREFKLRKAIADLGNKYRYIFIDCPPAVGLLTLNALSAADRLIIPVQCEFLAMEGLSEMMTTLELVQANLNPRLELGGIVLTMFDRRVSLGRQVVSAIRDHFPSTFQMVIPRNVRIAEAPSLGLPLMMYAPHSAGARAYKALAEEMEAILQTTEEESW